MFSDNVIEVAWKRCKGKCEKCGRSLVFVHKGKSGERGAWNTYDKSGLNNLGPDTSSNCQILCWRCFIEGQTKDRLKLKNMFK